MTTHMIQIYVEDVSLLNEAIENWADQYTQWEIGTSGVRRANTQDDQTYLSATYRFKKDSGMLELLTTLEDYITETDSDAWYRAKYHECDHDEDDRGSCEWNKIIESETVPDFVRQ